VPQDLVAAVKHNTELMNRFGFGGVPTIVAKQARTGELLTLEGALPTQPLAEKLGLLPPTS
jgi:thiol:disulfide interchange protein DsbG